MVEQWKKRDSSWTLTFSIRSPFRGAIFASDWARVQIRDVRLSMDAVG
jgi:hypothetical protein